MPGGGYIFITAVRNCKAAADQRETPTKPPPLPPTHRSACLHFTPSFFSPTAGVRFVTNFWYGECLIAGWSRSVGGGGGAAESARSRDFPARARSLGVFAAYVVGYDQTRAPTTGLSWTVLIGRVIILATKCSGFLKKCRFESSVFQTKVQLRLETI